MKTSSSVTYDRDAVRENLHAAIDGVADVLRDCADEAESEGVYPERGWRAMHDSGLFRMKAPAELGGLEADPVTQIEVFERVTQLDSSAGWTLFVGAGTLAMISGWLQEAALDDFMIDGRLPRVAGGVVPSGTAEPVEGGFRVTGRWQFGSGGEHAEWFSGNAFVTGRTPPVAGFIFPAADVTLHRNWDVNALKGTGSGDFSVEELFVPATHSFDNFAPAERGGALFRILLPGLFANEHGGFALGLGRRALDEMTELAKTKARGYVEPEGVAARGKFQFDLGRAETALEAARARLIDINESAWRTAVAEEATGPEEQTALRSAAIYATDVAMDVCREMFRYAGARSLFTGNVIERCLRDIHAAAQHGMINDAGYEARGRVLLGFPDVAALT